MKNLYSVTTLLFIFFQITFINQISFSQDSIKNCNSYSELYDFIKERKSASINRTEYIPASHLVEYSIAILEPTEYPPQGFKLTFKILDLKESRKTDFHTQNSVLGYMTKDCKKFKDDFEQFIGTSCYLYTETPEEARDIAKSGIDYETDIRYFIEGDLVLTFGKMCKDEIHPRPVKKPAVYLYPVTETEISVKLEVKGKITKSEPLYDKGWLVNASPVGLINNKYDYLFYEADLNNIEVPEEGWIVEYRKIEDWFDTYLPQFGLNYKEILQFKEYWLKKLKRTRFYEIKLLDKKFLDENMKLVISPEPQSILRLNFYFSPVGENVKLIHPVIPKFERKGFTVVEWGGINEDNIILSDK